MEDWHRFKNISTELLISYFQDKKKDKLTRDHALLSLMFRFRKNIIEKSEIICRNRGYDSEVAILIAENTFKNYARSCKFNIKECKASDNYDDCFLFYLFKIARNELIDYHHDEEKRKQGLLYDGTETIITKLPFINIDKLDPESRIIHDILLSLPYSHQVIYLTYKTHERPGVNLPRKLQAELRNHLGGIDQKTIRAYKKIAIDKIENAKSIINKLKQKSYE